ncbi:UNVERIFIED_CONTAM: hypothetical protein PYX00_010484 [Menopon gallinae]|uniref:Zinc transporter 8 n=1 Tax=Menopon gallinae TaxID=328185 RepID=A0AAW2HFQ1_9NEOP
MTSRYFGALVTEDAVTLLGNPLNSDHGNPDEFDHSEDCITCRNSGTNFCMSHNTGPHNDSNNVQCYQFASKYSNDNSRVRLILAICLCFLFMGAEVIGGYIAGSLAIITDGIHLVMDLFGFLISLIALSSSQKRSTKQFNLGFYRIEILSTLISITIIWVMTGIFMYLASVRLFNNDYEIEVDLMLLVSCFGVVINVVMCLVLHGGCSKRHMHSHISNEQGNSQGHQNINVQAAIIHVLGDLVQSIGVFISSLIIKFYPNAKFMDPVCTFLFSVIVICSTLKLLKDSVYIVMEACPSSINYNNVLVNLKGLNGVRFVHNLCIWSLTINTNVLTVHLVIDDSVDPEIVLRQAQKLFTKKYNIAYHTIQVEKMHSKCLTSCDKPSWN